MALRQRVLLFLPHPGRGTFGSREPLSLDPLYLAAPLVHSGLDVEVVDQRLDADWRSRISRSLRVDGGGPVCCAVFSAAGRQVFHALQACRHIRALRPDVPLVWGGPHPTSRPEQTLAHPLVDHVIVGPAENSLAALVASLAARKRPDNLPGVGCKDQQGRVRLAPPGSPVDLDALPRLPYEILDTPVAFAQRLPGRREVALTVCRSGRSDRMSPQRVVEEIHTLHQSHEIEAVHLLDSDALTNERWARHLCDEILRRGITPVALAGGCRIRRILDADPAFLRLLRNAGFTTLDIPVGSGSDRVLRLLKEDFTSQDVLHAAARCRDADLIPRFAFTAGLPHESLEDLHSTLRLMLELVENDPRARTGSLHLFTPIPSTRLWDLCLRNGMEEPAQLEDWITFGTSGTSYSPVEKRSLELAQSLSSFIETRPSTKGPLSSLNNLYTRIVRARIRRSFYRFMPEVHAIRYLRASSAP